MEHLYIKLNKGEYLKYLPNLTMSTEGDGLMSYALLTLMMITYKDT